MKDQNHCLEWNANMQPEICYRVGTRVFSSPEEAQRFQNETNKMKQSVEKNKEFIKSKKKDIRKNVENKYAQLGKPVEECNCGSSDYSEECLKHLCTCDFFAEFKGIEYRTLICDQHTNTHFKNKGCFWCRHTDCSKWGC